MLKMIGGKNDISKQLFEYLYKMVSIVFLIFSFNACIKVADNAELQTEKPYFDLPAFTKKQIQVLTELSTNNTAPVVIKQVKIGDKEEEITLIKGKDESYPLWKKELQLFEEADINKPVLLDAYEIIIEGSETLYKAKYPDLEIQEMKITSFTGEVKEIGLKINTENYLYTSYKDLKMQLDNGIISEVYMDGFRKLVGNDSLTYQMVTQLTFQ
ncbi:MAG: hypothetical protein AAGI07_07070 [Bacteroidota bacterium]